MILGLGTDIARISRIEEILDKHRDSFIRRVFTEAEISSAPDPGLPSYSTHLAGRWAAKEAISKALACGIGADCSWTDIEILSEASGKPLAKLSGKALETATKLGFSYLHISISHENEYAVAVALIEGEAK